MGILKLKSSVWLFLFSLMLLQNAHGQKTTLLSYEFGLNQKEINFNNPQGVVSFYNNRVGVSGLVLSQQIYKWLYLETGIYNDFLGCDMVVENNGGSNLILAQDQLNLPLRLQFRKSYFNEKIDAFLSVGANFVVGMGDYIYSFNSTQNETVLNTNKKDLKEDYGLVELGIGTDVYLTKNLFLGIRYRFGFGFSKIIDIHTITGNGADSNQIDYFLKSKGNYNAFVFTIGYRISSFWNK